MIVDFGPHFDGMRPDVPTTGAGRIAAGPQRLLRMLEQSVGLPTPAPKPGAALLAYQSCLEDLDHAGRFYHRSLAVDPIGVARTLLAWRASWHEAGWRGHFEHAVPPRLADLAQVETLARERVPLDMGQRLQRVVEALDSGLVTQIDRVVLHDTLDALPAAWRAVLARLPTESAAGLEPRAHAAPGTDLRRLQDALIASRARDDNSGARDGRMPPVELAGDASVVVLRGLARDLTAQTVAELLRDTPLDDAVLIAEHDGIIIDNALERVGLARAGFQHYSRFRAVTQVLKLALALVWHPLPAELVLQTLLHPVGPLPARVRSALAAAVAAEPGVGGRAWHTALAQIDDPGVRDEVAFWLEGERFPADEGAPIATLIERCQRTATWLTARLHGAGGVDMALYGAALAQAEALIGALDGLAARGAAALQRLRLERLVDEVTGHSPDPATFAEAGHVPATTAPGALTRPAPMVVWWDLAPLPNRAPEPWSGAELEALHAAGVELPSAEASIAAQSRAWQRPVLNAEERLVLVVHERDEGRHPLWSRLTSLARGFTEISVEDALFSGAPTLPSLDVETAPLEPRALPRKRRWWRLPAGVAVPRRTSESYSSLSKLAYYPHQWVLHYAARLQPGRAENLAAGALLYGTLAHRLFEAWFAQFADGRLPGSIDEAEVRRWAASELRALVRSEGAVLESPGMGVTRERIFRVLEQALLALLRHLRSADIVRVEAERWHETPCAGDAGEFTLQGAIDLLLTDSAGREVVLDVKWSGREWRGSEIAENRALQLATYGYFRSVASASRRWPEQAYFIVTHGDIVAADTSVFPEAIAFPPETPLTADAVWRRLLGTCAWRRGQLDAGEIEINIDGTEPDEASRPPEGSLEAMPGGDRFDPFGALTGWEPGE